MVNGQKSTCFCKNQLNFNLLWVSTQPNHLSDCMWLLLLFLFFFQRRIKLLQDYLLPGDNKQSWRLIFSSASLESMPVIYSFTYIFHTCLCVSVNIDSIKIKRRPLWNFYFTEKSYFRIMLNGKTWPNPFKTLP